MSLNLVFAVSYADLFITIKYAVFRKSSTTFYVSLYIYIYIYIRWQLSSRRSILEFIAFLKSWFFSELF